MIRRIPRWARWVLVLLLVVLALYLIIYTVLTSTAFSRFALDRVESAVPALSFSNVEGSFTRGLNFDLRYAEGGTEVRLKQGRLVFRPYCLWQMTVCIDSLDIDTLRVSLSTAEAEQESAAPDADGETALPEIALPVNIFLPSLAIRSLVVEQDSESVYQLDNLDTSLTWRGSTLRVNRLAASDPYCRWSLEGEVTFINQYPLSSNVACQSVAGYGQIVAAVSGDLEQLAAEVNARVQSEYTTEPAQLDLVISFAPLDEQLPITLEANIEEAVRVLVGEQSVQLESALVSVEGPLLSPDISAQLTFETPFWPGRNTMDLEAAATTEQLTLRSLTLQLPEGRVNARGELAYGEALAWRGGLNWQNIDLQQFSEEFAGELSGELSSQVNYAEGDLRAQVDLQSVTGTWLEKRLMASGQFDWQNQSLAIENLRVQQGENRLSVAGDFAPNDRMDLALQLNLPQLGELIPQAWAPEASGALEGSINLTGSLDDIAINSKLNASDIEYSDIRLARGQLQLQWFGLSERRGQIDLQLEQLAVAENLVSDVRLQGRGNVNQHSLQLALNGLQEHSDKSAQLQCSGGFADAPPSAPFERWQGKCGELTASFALHDEKQTWRLASPIEVDARPQSPALTLSSFCLNNGPASLCSREAISFEQGQLSALALAGEKLPVEWLQPFVPGDNVSVAGDWRFQFDGEQLLTEPQLSANVSSSNLVARWQTDKQPPISLQVTRLQLDWRGSGQQHQLSWQLQTQESGSGRGELNIEDQQISGNLTLAELQLANYSRLFLTEPEDELAGQVDAELAVKGSFQQPLLSGRISLDNGRFGTAALPVPLRKIQLRLDVNENRATADGSFRAADSDGDISGKFVWGQGAWSGELAVSAEPMLIQPEPGMQVHVAPDLQFTFAPKKITIAGQVRIPQAQIEITELPEQAETVSPDAVIVQEEGAEAETETPVAINTNIELVLGDQVHFEGFGLETRVTGRMRLQQDGGGLLRANGKLQLVEGRYKAYGQNLVIRSGDLVFVGDIDNPQLRLEAVRANTPEDVVVGLRASGPARNPQISLFSRPDMPQQAQLSYLLTGNPPGTKVETDPQLAAAEAALSYALESNVGTGITQRAGEALGIEDFQVTAGSTDNGGAQIGLSGYITPNLLVRYGVGVFEAINTVTLRYQMTKNVYLEAISGENSDIGIMWSFERD